MLILMLMCLGHVNVDGCFWVTDVDVARCWVSKLTGKVLAVLAACGVSLAQERFRALVESDEKLSRWASVPKVVPDLLSKEVRLAQFTYRASFPRYLITVYSCFEVPCYLLLNVWDRLPYFSTG